MTAADHGIAIIGQCGDYQKRQKAERYGNQIVKDDNAIMPDDLPVLRDQVRRQTDALVKTEDRQTLALVAQLLARVSETTPL